jgi:hypothetical protein
MARNLEDNDRETAELHNKLKALKVKNRRMADNYSSLLQRRGAELEDAKECIAGNVDLFGGYYNSIA